MPMSVQASDVNVPGQKWKCSEEIRERRSANIFLIKKSLMKRTLYFRMFLLSVVCVF